jgi:chromosome segregation ATPase
MAWPKALNPAGVIEELKRKIGSLQEQWQGTRRENERLRNENAQLRQQREQLEQERERLRQENEKLKRQLEEAQRANKRQAAPFPEATQTKPKTTRAQVRLCLWKASRQSHS